MLRATRIVHRTADGVRIPGTWRHAFIRNGGRYHLTDLFIYADGLIDCWELVTVEEFAAKLRSQWVATSFEEAADASAYGLVSWKLGAPQSWLTPELLLAEVRDTIDQLNERPDSTDRCLAAVDAYLADRTEEKRALALAAYHAIPESQRLYALGDMDHRDEPLRALLEGTGEEYAYGLAYFEERAREADAPAEREEPQPAAVQLYQSSVGVREGEAPGKVALRNDYPAPIEVDGVLYPSVAHAHCALSVADPAVRPAIAAASGGYAARTLADAAGPRSDWTRVRAGVMAELLRAKFARHPDLAAVLLATGDASLIYDDMSSDFFGDNGGRGRNWAGRLLELVRAELCLQGQPRDAAPGGAATMGE